jgi:phospholipid/cholesterol/gamma-HCH transport system ATP-binding protein
VVLTEYGFILSMDLIQVSSFKKSFGSKVIHRDISFSLQEREVLGLLGGSGTGKSVLLRSLVGLEKPDSGSITVLNEDLTDLVSESQWTELRKKVGYAFQDGALFDSLTVYDNLAFPLLEHSRLDSSTLSESIFSVLREFNLEDAYDKLPHQLSGGMQKRVGLARALMLKPRILLYDEPTAGLDPGNTQKVQSMIKYLKGKGIGGILVTHDMPVAFDVCDRIAFLNHGVIEVVSTPEEIQKNPDHPILKFSRGQL